MPATPGPVLPEWAIPWICSVAEHAPALLAELYATRCSLVRHVLCLNASFDRQPDWPALARAIGEDASDPRVPGRVAMRLLKMPVKALIEEAGPFLQLTPFVASVLRKTTEYLHAPEYRQLAGLEQLPASAPRIRALVKSPPLTRRRLAIALEVDVAFVHPAIIARLEGTDTEKFNRMVREMRQDCAPGAEEALFQALLARSPGSDNHLEAILREVVSQHYRIRAPEIRPGSELQVLDNITALRSAGIRLRNCLGSFISRRILAGERLAVVLCTRTDMVALLRPVSCGARRAWLVKEVGARANRATNRHERAKFISYINTQLDEPVWTLTDDLRQRDPNLYNEQQTDLEALFGSFPDDF